MAQESWDRFEAVKDVGGGTYGRILLVKDREKENREVAIKVPHDKEKERALINDLIHTARLEGMRHTNIVRYLGFGQYRGLYVMIMEYVEGENLRKRIGPYNQKREPMAIDMALQITIDICRGLVAVHEAGVVHRVKWTQLSRQKIAFFKLQIDPLLRVNYRPTHGLLRMPASAG